MWCHSFSYFLYVCFHCMLQGKRILKHKMLTSSSILHNNLAIQKLMNEILLSFRLSVVTSGYTTILLLLSGCSEYWKQSLWSIRKAPVLRSVLQPRPLPIKKLSLLSTTTFSVKLLSKKCFKFVACMYSEVVRWLNESWTSTEWRKVVAFNFKYRHAICVRILKKKKTITSLSYCSPVGWVAVVAISFHRFA